MLHEFTGLGQHHDAAIHTGIRTTAVAVLGVDNYLDILTPKRHGQELDAHVLGLLGGKRNAAALASIALAEGTGVMHADNLNAHIVDHANSDRAVQAARHQSYCFLIHIPRRS